MIPQAVANATAILAGNYMGARQGEDAEAVVSLGFIICFSYGSLAGAVLIFVCRPVCSDIMIGVFDPDSQTLSTAV
jgi:Na+-driven multidrug efflux pump